ncbi:fructokinase [Nocardioides thalensis]|uniref:Fructokinase n=1 Tax=Nocardioides thalensis TaxID=1914755 RepID=A0A853C3F5_9ACTN|nr:fructokinase [Nocardioides thalensis]
MSSVAGALVVGETLVDAVVAPDGAITERPGGSAANAAVALARLERPVRLATAYGDDARGRLLDAHLAAEGVAPAGDPHALDHTSVATARIGDDGAATYDFDVTWRLGPVAAGAPHVLHVCSLAPVLPPGADDVLALVDEVRSRTTVTYDLNARPSLTGTGREVVTRVQAMVRRTDLVKASDEDLLALWPDRSVEESSVALLGLGPVAVVVTRGADGATWHVAGEAGVGAGAVDSEPVDVVDTIGAGDTFGAGLLDALWPALGAGGRARLAALDADEWSAALRHAARCAAVTVSRPGADPPRRSDLPATSEA